MKEYVLPNQPKFKQQTQKILAGRLKRLGTDTATPQGFPKSFAYSRSDINYEKSMLQKILRSRKPISAKLWLIMDFYSKC
jgi:hypothetical protein